LKPFFTSFIISIPSPHRKASMTSIESILTIAGLPDGIRTDIMEYNRPTSLAEDLKNDVELLGTYTTFKNIGLECDELWVPYYQAWNSLREPGRIHQDEEDLPSPPHVWDMIENHLVGHDKDLAQYYLEKINAIMQTPSFLDKHANFQKTKWEYTYPEEKYVETVVTMTPHEIIKDFTGYAECLRRRIDQLAQAERLHAHAMGFETNADFEQAMEDDYIDFMENQPRDPYDDW
jgi:hypothetical protein